MADRYRIYCLQSQADALPSGVEVEATYPAFVVARVPASEVARVSERFPISPMDDASGPPEPVAPAEALATVRSWPARGPYTVLVRFVRPVAEEAEERLSAAGAEPIRAIGNRSWIARCPTREVVGRLEGLDDLDTVELFVPTVRVTPEFFHQDPPSLPDVQGGQPAEPATAPGAPGSAEGSSARESAVREAAVREAAARAAAEGAIEPLPDHLPGLLTARFHDTGDRDRAIARLARAGVDSVRAVGDRLLSIDLTRSTERMASVESILDLDGLEHLEEKKLARYFNDIARQIIGQGVLEAAPEGLGLDGSGEIVAVADSGLDTGDASTIHPDFRGRIVDIESFPITPDLSDFLTNPQGDDGASDRFSGHGTHVAGSVLGDGTRARDLGLEPIEGAAPGARLVFQALDQETRWSVEGVMYWFGHGRTPPEHGLFGIPEQISDLFQPAFDQGARIHSDSWGGGSPGVYDEQCRQLDQYVWENRDFLVVVAAGNDGADGQTTAAGIDPTSISSPGVAKNCLTVGASENRRPDQAATYGDIWQDEFPRAPYSNDPMADDPDDVVAFSSRGPCNSGRRKPDLVAPGTWVLSTRSSAIADDEFGWGELAAARDDYMYMGGTSMATPLVSGCAAVLRQFLRQERDLPTPSAALVKAGLIHSCTYLDYRFAGPVSRPFADDEQGYGRVDLATLLRPADGVVVHFVDHRDELAEGALFELEVKVTDPAVPLRATLVYTDFPGEDLVHDLHLFAFAPGGAFRLGNDFDADGVPDSVNNVEQVRIAEPEEGVWRLRVVAAAVPNGGQDFALVVSGALADDP